MSPIHTFYKLQQPHYDEAYQVYGNPNWDREFGRAEWTDEVKLETIRCSIHPGHQRAGKRIGNLAIKLPSPKVGDFTWTWASNCLITDSTLLLFREARFSGFAANTVSVKFKLPKDKKARVPALWELVVTGKAGDADPRSGIRLIYTCAHCGLIEYSSFRNGIFINENTWDGSDFFTITGYGFIFVTERVKELIVRRTLTNCALIPSQELEWKSLSRPEDIYIEQQ